VGKILDEIPEEGCHAKKPYLSLGLIALDNILYSNHEQNVDSGMYLSKRHSGDYRKKL